jgi:putative transposase
LGVGHVPPVEYEIEYYRHNQPAKQPLAGELSLH